MRVLVTGVAGFLGGEVVRLAGVRGDQVIGTYRRRPPAPSGATYQMLDIRDRGAVAAVVAQADPGLVVHTAYLARDWATTAQGAAHVALAAAAVGARLVRVSSDAVFSGAQTSYRETACPDPVNPYGAAKAAAETAVAAVHPGAAIVRTSLLMGGPGSQFEAVVRQVAGGDRNLAMFTDDVRCAGHVADVAAALLELADVPGVHHVAGSDAVSRMELAELVCARDGLPTYRLRPGLRADVPVPGPLDLRLDCATTAARLSTRLRGAREFLRPSGRL